MSYVCMHCGLPARLCDQRPEPAPVVLPRVMDDPCPRCFGRGYQPEARRPSKRNPNGLGFYARTCPRCRGTGSIPLQVRQP